MDAMAHASPFHRLSLADPDLAREIARECDRAGLRLSSEDLAGFTEEAVWGLSVEINFGRSFARGLMRLMGGTGKKPLDAYRALVHEAAERGPAIARLFAEHLVPVLSRGDEALKTQFLDTIEIMSGKGTYTLKTPLEAFSQLLETGARATAPAYLDLLGETFSRDLTYNQSRHFAEVLPRSVLAFPPARRRWQTEFLCDVIRADFRLVDPFLEGMEKGLFLLSKKALGRFLEKGVKRHEENPDRGRRFLSLRSKTGIDTFSGMQVAVPLSEVRESINRYLRARTGMALSILPLSALPREERKRLDDRIRVFSDSRYIYLPDEIDRYPVKAENRHLYRSLAKLEAAHHEFGTFEFDLEKIMERRAGGWAPEPQMGQTAMPELERFYRLFPVRALAEDLFTLFEHGRIRVLLSHRYPGILRQALPLLLEEARIGMAGRTSAGRLHRLYLRIALGCAGADLLPDLPPPDSKIDEWESLFHSRVGADTGVAVSAEMVFDLYPEIFASIGKPNDYTPLSIPFERRFRPDLIYASNRKVEDLAHRIKVRIEETGFGVYRSDLKRLIGEKADLLSIEDIREIVFYPNSRQAGDNRPSLSGLDLSGLLTSGGGNTPLPDPEEEGVCWYPEWSSRIGDFLENHVRVRDRTMGGGENDFYDRILRRRRNLVGRIRRVFERLKPEGLKILRQWIEGDAFDYRALLDFAIDRRAGLTPSERLYIKRLKQDRDIGVLLLVDLSHSTSNPALAATTSVLDVEKESIVLFCEALDVLGDAFAVAGFSGTGRLGVDYFRIKDFEDALVDEVRQRIGAMCPQRGTRMGAAIRHATNLLERAPSRIRLMIILGDGFPNDLDYKQGYAISDTRTAILEARSKNISVKAITVNIAADPKLDDLYGNIHHNVITDVRELPDRLLHIYSALTRY
jgi:nitric oxide reductase NorD protein